MKTDCANRGDTETFFSIKSRSIQISNAAKHCWSSDDETDWPFTIYIDQSINLILISIFSAETVRNNSKKTPHLNPSERAATENLIDRQKLSSDVCLQIRMEMTIDVAF